MPAGGEREGVGEFCPQALSRQSLKPCGAHSASLGDTLAGQGIKAARGNKVCGQDNVSVKLEAASQKVQEPVHSPSSALKKQRRLYAGPPCREDEDDVRSRFSQLLLAASPLFLS